MAQELRIPQFFNSIKIKLASPEEILEWSYGEVLKPESINYRTQRPEKDGLFSERIFGPTKDWECYCGKYKRIRYKGIVCDKCGVEVTKSSVRRERMGHIKLAAPVTHIWFLRSAPSRIGMMLDISLNQLERVIYYTSYIITQVDETVKNKILADLDKEYLAKLKDKSARKESLEGAYKAAREELNTLRIKNVITEAEYHKLSLRFGPIFKAEIGAEPIKRMLSQINLEDLKKELEDCIAKDSPDPLEKKKIFVRLKLVNSFIKNNIRPEWMFLDILPVLPADLRPMVQLDGGRFASSDLNDLYRRIINRNNRLKKLLELRAPEVIVRNEKRILQEAVDALLDNSARRNTGQQQVKSSTGGRRPLKSIADMLKGKQGRFRQNLLGKRVDYSARSVIVVGPELRLWECGMPKRMALELFKPFVIYELIKRDIANNIRNASRLIEEGTPEVWDALEEVIQGKYVLLNRAPTLHRLGIQAFRPVLMEGLALSIPPMVCGAFNADFDGDQMAAHLPLSQEAQKEAADFMLASKGILKPGTGDAIAIPTLDMILGCYWLSKIIPGAKGEDKIFIDANEAILAYEMGIIDLKAKITIRRFKDEENFETSVGRLLFNQVLPEDFPVVNRELNKKFVTSLVNQILARYGLERTPYILDEIKNLGFKYATLSGISWGLDDLPVIGEKQNILENAEKENVMIEQQFEEGLLTKEEKRLRAIEIWSLAKQKIEKAVPNAFSDDNSVFAIIDSGSRSSWTIINQMMGMKGLVYNPAGEIIELPIRSSYKEGFNVLEYFISTHGARKGTTDTALRTASAGYLTRRMVDVAQDILINEEDCGDTEGMLISKSDTEEIGETIGYRAFSRVSLEDIKDDDGKNIVNKGEIIDREKSYAINQLNLESIKVRSPLSCKTLYGLCARCYGLDLGTGNLIELGQAAGIVAAQSIGEPGTQLTMRTFHTGGVAGGADITQGLPRVEEIFETRIPKGKAVISEIDGRIEEIKPILDGNKIIVKSAEMSVDYFVPKGMGVTVALGQEIKKGDRLSEGNLDIKEYFKLVGEDRTKKYILNEIKKVYSFQGAPIHDKHVEIVVKKMFSRVRIRESGDSDFLAGEIVPIDRVKEENQKLAKANLKPIKAQLLVMGISKVALSTDSFLSAASFQETARVLIKAALNGSVDHLRGLKENVIIGRLIPAGTGFLKLDNQKSDFSSDFSLDAV